MKRVKIEILRLRPSARSRPPQRRSPPSPGRPLRGFRSGGRSLSGMERGPSRAAGQQRCALTLSVRPRSIERPPACMTGMAARVARHGQARLQGQRGQACRSAPAGRPARGLARSQHQHRRRARATATRKMAAARLEIRPNQGRPGGARAAPKSPDHQRFERCAGIIARADDRHGPDPEGGAGRSSSGAMHPMARACMASPSPMTAPPSAEDWGHEGGNASAQRLGSDLVIAGSALSTRSHGLRRRLHSAAETTAVTATASPN